MADDEKASVGVQGKLKKLLAVQQELLERLGAVTTEMDDLLGGGVGIGALLKRLEQHYDRLWCVRYVPGQSGRYVWAYVKDRPQMKRLLKLLSVEELEVRMINYLRNDDPFYTRARHNFGVFVASVNSHASASSAPAADVEIENDVAQTRERIAAMKRR